MARVDGLPLLPAAWIDTAAAAASNRPKRANLCQHRLLDIMTLSQRGVPGELLPSSFALMTGRRHAPRLSPSGTGTVFFHFPQFPPFPQLLPLLAARRYILPCPMPASRRRTDGQQLDGYLAVG